MPKDRYGEEQPDGVGQKTFHVKVTAQVSKIMSVSAPNPMQARANALGAFMQKDIGGSLIETDDGSDPFTSAIVNLDAEAKLNRERRAKLAALKEAKDSAVDDAAQAEMDEANALPVDKEQIKAYLAQKEQEEANNGN